MHQPQTGCCCWTSCRRVVEATGERRARSLGRAGASRSDESSANERIRQAGVTAPHRSESGPMEPITAFLIQQDEHSSASLSKSSASCEHGAASSVMMLQGEAPATRHLHPPQRTCSQNRLLSHHMKVSRVQPARVRLLLSIRCPQRGLTDSRGRFQNFWFGLALYSGCLLLS